VPSTSAGSKGNARYGSRVLVWGHQVSAQAGALGHRACTPSTPVFMARARSARRNINQDNQ